MNLGPQKISDTYQLVLNQSGSSVTLGNGNNPNWIGTTVASTTGNQTISGTKTFTSTIIGSVNGSSSSSTTSSLSTTSSNIDINTTNGGGSDTTMYPLLVRNDATGTQSIHIDSAKFYYNAATDVLVAPSFSGNSLTASTLQTSRTINGVSFNGSANIVVEPYIENDNTSNATRYLTFVDNSGAAYQRLNNDNNLTYNPFNGTLTTYLFSLGTQTNKATISYAQNVARTFTIPSVTANSTFAFIDQAQTFSSAQIFNSNLTVKGNLDFGSSTLGGSAASSFLKTNAGQLGTTAGNTLNLASIGFNSTNATSLSFIARRQSAGSNWESSSIGLTYNVDAVTGVGPGGTPGVQEIWMLPNGNVGLGTNAPTQKLDINGNLRVGGSITCTNGIGLSSKNTKLTVDVSMPTANTWYNIVSISLEAGTWLVNTSLLYVRTNNTADIVYCRVGDGTNHYASTSENRTATANATLNLATTTIITVASTTTIWLQAAQNTTAAANVALTKAAMIANGAGNNATQITAIRVG
jgi:hypothetical protein